MQRFSEIHQINATDETIFGKIFYMNCMVSYILTKYEYSSFILQNHFTAALRAKGKHARLFQDIEGTVLELYLGVCRRCQSMHWCKSKGSLYFYNEV